jgi:hypothetical protein
LLTSNRTRSGTGSRTARRCPRHPCKPPRSRFLLAIRGAFGTTSRVIFAIAFARRCIAQQRFTQLFQLLLGVKLVRIGGTFGNIRHSTAL